MRGTSLGAGAPYVPPPMRGHGKPPSVNFPRFDRENPKLWQTRCMDYFEIFDTEIWIVAATMQFEGPAVWWLFSVQHKFVRSSWEEFCAEVLARFGRNNTNR